MATSSITLPGAGSKVLTDVDSTIHTQVIAAKLVDETGALYGPKQVDGKLRTVSMPYTYAIAEGDVTNHTAFHKLGWNPDIDDAEEDIWPNGGTYVFPDAGGIDVEVVSTSTSDTLAGVGAQKVRVDYLKADYSTGTQTVEMNGQTAVELTEQNILRVQAIRVVQGAAAVGTISCRDVTTTARIYRAIQPTMTRGRALIYTVPLAKTMYITSIWLHGSASSYTRFFLRANYDDAAGAVLPVGLFQPIWGATVSNQACFAQFPMPLKIPATCDLRMSAQSAAGNSNSVCHCVIDGWTE